ncbi:MAG: hydrolase, partial [Acidimicrobiia bacterium]|nr:hydrolase [Acidimicrobiia bacterium]
MQVVRAPGILDSPARVDAPTRPPFRIGAVQHRWHADPVVHRAALTEGANLAAAEGAQLVCLQELTLSRYFAIAETNTDATPEPLPGGPTHEFASDLARRLGVPVHASLWEAAADGGLGFNTAIVVTPTGELLARTRKVHIPVTAGYYEDRYFRPGDTGYPVIDIASA